MSNRDVIRLIMTVNYLNYNNNAINQLMIKISRKSFRRHISFEFKSSFHQLNLNFVSVIGIINCFLIW